MPPRKKHLFQPKHSTSAFGPNAKKKAKLRAERIADARTDIHTFAEMVMRDERTGKPIKQAPLHDLWHQTIDQNERVVIWSSVESGKTQNISVCRTLFELGRNPNLTVAILSDTAPQAEKTIRAIMSYIERSDELHAVFPDLQPGDQWGVGGCTVKRSGYAKDPSIQAVGVRGNITGSRLGLLIIDDVLDYENCRTPTRRQELYEWYLSVMPGRLYEGSRVICVGTAYHPEDLMHRFARDGWKAQRYPVVDAVTGLSRWPENWSQERIKAKYAELGSLEFSRQMLCVARDDASARFKREWIQKALIAGIGRAPAMKIEHLPSGFKTYTGVDPAIEPEEKHDLTAITTILVEPSGRRHLLEVLAGNWAGPDIVGRIEDAHRRFGSIVMVESNQAQKYLVQFLRARSGITVRAFNTGKNKYNPQFGVESLAVEMEGGLWCIPSINGEQGATTQMEALVQDMLYYDPMGHTGDRLMSLWLAREGARLGAGAFSASTGYLGLSDR
jgi:hypothetical protein